MNILIRYNNKIPLYKGNKIIKKALDTTQPAPGMIIWHKADAATASNDESGKNTMKNIGSIRYITRLWDFSGNNFHGVTSSTDIGLFYSATQSQNGKPGLISSASFPGLRMNYATASSLHTTFTVATTKTNTSSGNMFIPVLEQGGSWDDRNVEFNMSRDSSDITKSVMGISPNGSYGIIFTRSGLTAGNTFMGKAICKKLSTSYLDPGEFEVSVSGMPTDGSFTDTVTEFSRYGLSDGPNHSFNEFIHYNRVLTEVEILQTEEYLKSKWGMTF